MKNQIKTIVLMGALSAVVVGFGALVAPGHLALFGAMALAMNLGAYFFSDRIVLRMHNAQPVSVAEAPGLHAMVEELSARAGIPMPRVFLIPEHQPNAFATGRNPQHGVIAVTEGILRILDRRELRGVLAHEIAHIKNRDILISSIAAAGAALISYAAQALSFGALFGGPNRDDEQDSSGGFLAALVAPLAATLIQLGISRSREYLADETGAHLSGDPGALASALWKLEQTASVLPAQAPTQASAATASLFIVNPFGGLQAVSRWFATHPSTEERVHRLQQLAMRNPRPTARRYAYARGQ
jgi:heat shock protein HtpX